MHPVLLRFPYFGAPLTIHWYGVLMLLGMALAIALACRRAPRYGVAPMEELALGALCVCGGLAGAWVLFVMINLKSYIAEPIALVRAPGLVFYGGFLGAGAAALVYARAYRLPLGAMADAGAPALALGHAVGRVGCFMGGCCYGRPTTSPLGVVFPDHHTPAGAYSSTVGALHPTQLYEAAGLAALALVLALVSRPLARRAPGTLVAVYVAGYALLRLGIEHFRGDTAERVVLFAGLATSQVIAGAMLVVGVALAWGLGRRSVPA